MTQTARLYGGSLYDLAAEDHRTERILEQMQQIRRLFAENPDYIRLLSEPSIPVAERIGLIETAFGVQAERYLVNFIKLLCERSLLREYADCCKEYVRRYNIEHNITEAVVTSAVPLSEAQMAALTDKLSALCKKTVSLTQRTDPAVLAGLRVELEGKQLDGTVSGRLAGISRKLDEIIV